MVMTALASKGSRDGRWQMLLTEALPEIAPPNSEYVQNILKNSARLRDDVREFAAFIEGYEVKLLALKVQWPSDREEGFDIAQTASIDFTSPVIDGLHAIELSISRQLYDVRRVIRSQSRWMPALFRQLNRWEDYLTSAAIVMRDIRWDVMAIRASQPVETPSESFENIAELRRAVGRRA